MLSNKEKSLIVLGARYQQKEMKIDRVLLQTQILTPFLNLLSRRPFHVLVRTSDFHKFKAYFRLEERESR